MLTPAQAREAAKLLDDLEHIGNAIVKVQKKIWRENPGDPEATGGLMWDNRELHGVSVPKQDLEDYLQSRYKKAIARLSELGVKYP